MIYIGKHSKKFENEFCNIVLNKVGKIEDVKEFVFECKKFIPKEIIDVDDTNEFLRQLILLPYCKIEQIYNCITNDVTKEKYDAIIFSKGKMKTIFKKYHDCYDKVRDYKYNNKKISIALTEDLNLTVCPYCNRDYINGRSDDKSGCQLDHFFCRSNYPFLAVSLYNLVPSCSVCNNIKREHVGLVSPFDDRFEFDNEIKFSYIKSKDYIELKRNNQSKIKKNIDTLKLEDAYQIHISEVKKILEKKETYVASNLDEIAECINKWTDKRRKCGEIDRHYLQNLIYGKEIVAKDYKTYALGKFKHDILEYYNIYE